MYDFFQGVKFIFDGMINFTMPWRSVHLVLKEFHADSGHFF